MSTCLSLLLLIISGPQVFHSLPVPTLIPAIMSLTVRDPSRTLHTPTPDRHGVGFNVNEAISFIVEALKDPLNPRWCAPSIIACMVVIQPDVVNGDDIDELEALVNRNHQFGTTIIAFLTAKRSLADIESLASRWSECSCSYDNNTMAMLVHQICATMCPMIRIASERRRGKEGKFKTFEAVVRNFARFFENAVRNVKPFSISKGRHPEIWPVTPKDIIPYGG